MLSTSKQITVWTIGHSTRTTEEFLEMLVSAGIRVLADVRQFPGSRRYPQFGKDQLAVSLSQAGIQYVHFPELGGRRKPKPDSHNMAWRNAAFRGYADYMETEPFCAGIARLLDFAQNERLAIMCAEAVWWRCHRGLVADFLKAEGIDVLHILGRGKIEPHPFTSAAQLVGGKLSYSPVEPELRFEKA